MGVFEKAGIGSRVDLANAGVRDTEEVFDIALCGLGDGDDVLCAQEAAAEAEKPVLVAKGRVFGMLYFWKQEAAHVVNCDDVGLGHEQRWRRERTPRS